MGGSTTQYHRPSQRKKPWSLVKNGDLCQSIEEVAIAKGPNTIKASKVKGHATEEMIEAGIVRREDKRGKGKTEEAKGNVYSSCNGNRKGPISS